jgi:transposase
MATTTGGRPTKLTPDIQVKIVDALKMGNYIETAAALAGINKTSIYEWLKRGARELERVENNPNARIRKEEEPFVKFSNAVQKAQAESEQRDLLIIAKAGQTDWKASAWRLERKYPQRWGRKERLDFEAKVTQENINREETIIEQRIFSDPASVDLLKQLYRRQSALD